MIWIAYGYDIVRLAKSKNVFISDKLKLNLVDYQTIFSRNKVERYDGEH